MTCFLNSASFWGNGRIPWNFQFKIHFSRIEAKKISLPFRFILLRSGNDGSFRFFFVLFSLHSIFVSLQISMFLSTFFASKRTKFCFRFASFHFEAKMTAHPTSATTTSRHGKEDMQRPRPPPICLQRLRSPTHYYISAASSVSPFYFSSTPVLAPVPTPPPTTTTSSQSPAISAYVIQNPEVKSSSFISRENQSLLDPPQSYKKIPNSVPIGVKTSMQKFSSILRSFTI